MTIPKKGDVLFSNPYVTIVAGDTHTSVNIDVNYDSVMYPENHRLQLYNHQMCQTLISNSFQLDKAVKEKYADVQTITISPLYVDYKGYVSGGCTVNWDTGCLKFSRVRV